MNQTQKVLLTAAITGLFAVTAQAGNKKTTEPAKKSMTEKECTDAKKQWKEGECVCAEAATPEAPAKK